MPRTRTPGTSVNVSGRQLERDELVDEVRAMLDDAGLEPSALTLEINHLKTLPEGIEEFLNANSTDEVFVEDRSV